MASLLQLHFLIVGGGIGGLSAAHTLALAGHRVTLLESKAEFGELGAGVQLGPNITRLLFHWGLEQEIDRLAVRPAGLCFRKGNTGEQIKYQVWGETLEKKCGAPLVHLHRADLHKILLGLIQSWPSVSVCLDAKVTAIDPKAPSLTLQSGETIYGDVVIAADGVYSRMYEHITGDSAPPKPTGVIIYRGLVPAELVLKDPDLRSLVDNPENTAWTGINHLVVTYVVVSHTLSYQVCITAKYL
jgi:salicylate hydroxylase